MATSRFKRMLRYLVSLTWVRSHFFIGMLLLGTLVGFYFTHSAYIDQWFRYRTFDLYQQLKPRTPQPEKMAAGVAIIDIDEASLAAYGQWPWPRNLIAQLVNNLMEYGVLAVGFDMVFPEHDRTSPEQLASTVPNLPESVTVALKDLPSHETIFADSLSKSRVVLGQAGITQSTNLSTLVRKVGYGKRMPAPGLPDPELFLGRYPGLIRNLPELENAAEGMGLFSTRPDSDGIYRRVALIERVGHPQNAIIYPSLSLEMLRVALRGKDDYQINSREDGTGIAGVVVRTAVAGQYYTIPTDANGQVWIHFASYDSTRDPIYISAKSVLEKNVVNWQQRLQNAMVVVGTSAVGLKDIRATPINSTLPGVEVHAQLLETILSSAHLTRPDIAYIIEMAVIMIGGLMMILLVPRMSALFTFLFSASMIAGLVGLAWHYYTQQNILVDASYPALSIFLMFFVLSYLNYIREESQKRQIRTAFGHYVSKDLLEELAANPEKLTLGGETRNITILFSDIRGFTTISERFNAQELTRFINSYLTPMTNVIMEAKGTIDKYMGDAIMAFWNAPLDVPNHPFQACQAALDMQKAVRELNAKMREESEAAKHATTSHNRRYSSAIQIGIGINTGDCCVGNMGSDQRFDYSALGDDVNLASRLEGQSKTYGVGIVLGENTYHAIKNAFACLELDLIQVKGKTQPVRVYALMGDAAMQQSPIFQTASRTVEALLSAYRDQQWDDAESSATALAEQLPDLATLAALYQQRISEYRESPPAEDWNGAYIATSK